jgi:NAD(P)H-dependent FMN reductase
MMVKILGISGSLRRASFNTALLRAAASLMEEGSQLELASIEGIPLYNGDVEAAEGSPTTVVELKSRILACDGLLLATPEYNGGVPGVFKNAIDWLSRPSADIPNVFSGRPIAVIGATPGPSGTMLAQNQWLSTLRALGTRPFFGGRVLVSHASKVFNPAGELTDEAVKSNLREFLRGFAAFANGA